VRCCVTPGCRCPAPAVRPVAEHKQIRRPTNTPHQRVPDNPLCWQEWRYPGLHNRCAAPVDPCIDAPHPTPNSRHSHIHGERPVSRH
tara:strand:- start:132580 stop:132840 length:261 start_codon:yes stop_codon:yes gene_type:complete